MSRFQPLDMFKACARGRADRVILIVDERKDDKNFEWYLSGGLAGACAGGHKDLAEMMINLGANDWNSGLKNACYGGHKELVELMISHGADDWQGALINARSGGHEELVHMLLKRQRAA